MSNRWPSPTCGSKKCCKFSGAFFLSTEDYFCCCYELKQFFYWILWNGVKMFLFSKASCKIDLWSQGAFYGCFCCNNICCFVKGDSTWLPILWGECKCFLCGGDPKSVCHPGFQIPEPSSKSGLQGRGAAATSPIEKFQFTFPFRATRRMSWHQIGMIKEEIACSSLSQVSKWLTRVEKLYVHW